MDGGLAGALERLGGAQRGSFAAPFAAAAVLQRVRALSGRPGTARRDAAAAVRRCLDSDDKVRGDTHRQAGRQPRRRRLQHDVPYTNYANEPVASHRTNKMCPVSPGCGCRKWLRK